MAKRNLESLFQDAAEVLGLNTTAERTGSMGDDFYARPFAKLDDYAPPGNPYRYMIAIVHKGTGESDFLGSGRRTAAEMESYLRGILATEPKRLQHVKDAFPGLSR